MRAHPDNNHFIAQSSGNYIAIFDAESPFKMNKKKRFEGHKIAGFNVKCCISPDGGIIASGAANGSIHFYDWYMVKKLGRIHNHKRVCMDVSFHPLLPSMLASCSWDNTVIIYE